MQQFYSAAKNQSRPPLVFATAASGNDKGRSEAANHHVQRHRASTTSSPLLSSFNSQPALKSSSHSCRETSAQAKGAPSHDSATQQGVHESSTIAQSFQQMVSSQRTASNFLHCPPFIEGEVHCRQFLSDAIKRGVECATRAPNQKNAESTTFHRILSRSVASERLLDIIYEVAYQRLVRNKLSGIEACRNEAMRKREKWSTVPAFIVATVSGIEDQHEDEQDQQSPYIELPLVVPNTIQQLDDYTSSCASIQNLLLSLHSEGLASRWETGTIIRTSALRNLIGCKKDDMIVGLIMIGWAKQVPRMPRRRRELEGDVLRNVDI